MNASSKSEQAGNRLRPPAVAADTNPQIREWLQRLTQLRAHVSYIVKLFRHPEIAGGQSLEGETYAARAAAGDRTLLFDCMGYLGDTIAELRQQIAAEMGKAPTTTAIPGSPEKVAVMIARAEAGYDLFIDGDAQVDVS